MREKPIGVIPRSDGPSITLGTAVTTTGRRVAVPCDVASLTRHWWVEGSTGTGKSTLLIQLALELERNGIGYTLLEHHGTTADALMRLLPESAADRTDVVRHGSSRLDAGLNVLAPIPGDDGSIADQLSAELIELIQGMFDPRQENVVGPRWRRWFSLISEGVRALWGAEATLLHVASVASDLDRVRWLARRIAPRHPELAHRLVSEVADLRGDDASSMVSWAMSKFYPFVNQRAMRRILGQPRDAVDVTAMMDAGRSLIVDLGGPSLGADAARTLGGMWLMKHWVAMGRRADRSTPHVIIVDEAQLYTFGALPAMLAEARKFGVGIVLAAQNIDALAPTVQDAVEANVGSFLSFRLGLRNAGRGSIRLGDWDARELTRLPDLQAAVALGGAHAPAEPFLLTVPLPRFDDASEHRAARLEFVNVARRDEAPFVAPPTDAAIVSHLHATETRPMQHAEDGPSFLAGWLGDAHDTPTGQVRVSSAPSR